MADKPTLSLHTLAEGSVATSPPRHRSRPSHSSSRQAHLSPVSPLFARRVSPFSLQYTPTNGEPQLLPDALSSPLTFTPIEDGETLSSRLLALSEEAVKGPLGVQSLSKIDMIITGQRILTVRNYSDPSAANPDLWELNTPALVSIARKMVDCWTFTDNVLYDDIYLDVLQSILSLCVMKSISPWPDKHDRMRVYAKLSELESSYSTRGLTCALLRELVVLSIPGPPDSKSYIRRIIDASNDPNLKFDHDVLIGELISRPVLDHWVEHLILISEALRTPTDSFVSFVIGLISDVVGVARRPSVQTLDSEEHKPATSSGSIATEIAISVIDSFKLSAQSRREVFTIGLLSSLRSSISNAFSHSSCAAISRLARIMISRRMHTNLALALSEALQSPQEVILSDMWPHPNTISTGANASSSAVTKVNKFDSLEARVRASNEKMVQKLRDIITCPLVSDVSEDMVNLSCGHYFDRISITRWLAQTPRCPQCRKIVTLQGRALWVSGVVDLIKEIEGKKTLFETVRDSVPESPKPVVGIFMNSSVTVIGIKYDEVSDVELISDWANDTSFAVPTVVYTDANSAPIGWGGDRSQLDELMAKIPVAYNTCHILASECTEEHLTYFLAAIYRSVHKYLNRRTVKPAVPAGQMASGSGDKKSAARFILSVTDQFCPESVHDPRDRFSRSLREAGFVLSDVEVIPETMCAALFSLDLNTGGVRKPSQVLHVVNWDYFGLSQGLYQASPEDRFGLWRVDQQQRGHEVYARPASGNGNGYGKAGVWSSISKPMIIEHLVKHVSAALGSSADEDREETNEIILAALRKILECTTTIDDILESIPVSKTSMPKYSLDMYTAAMYFADDSLFQDLLHLHLFCKPLELDLKLDRQLLRRGLARRCGVAVDISRAIPGSGVEAQKVTVAIGIDENGVLTIPSYNVALCVTEAAISGLMSVADFPVCFDIDDPITMVIFGSCADDNALMKQATAWISSGVFKKPNVNGVLTVRGGSNTSLGFYNREKTFTKRMNQASAGDYGNTRVLPQYLSNEDMFGRGSVQMAIDGLWLACKMAIAHEE
ncbi:hypothetical protein BZA70DRAFT_153532 [Myxozyma melibiosi]|uniref:U-box domain-containing protein n=1 Tax=Myxozyma melibiosi TaxID=54550 RepID=A0ABR1F681_9ASCO